MLSAARPWRSIRGSAAIPDCGPCPNSLHRRSRVGMKGQRGLLEQTFDGGPVPSPDQQISATSPSGKILGCMVQGSDLPSRKGDKGESIDMRKIATVLIALVVGACAYKHQPIYNVDRSMPAGAATLPMGRIEEVIVSAGQIHNWKFQHIDTGHLIATQSDVKHSAEVDILFDQKSWRIIHRSTTGMADEGGTIHSHYNVWIRNLEKDIDTRLTNVALIAK